MMKWIVVAVLLGGCRQLLGFDEVGGSPDATDCASCPAPVSCGDRDADGVADGCDNCADVVNVDQANDDGDAFGDACDPCLGHADADLHDEDADGVPDGCDNCPPSFNPDQANADGDGLGDVCDAMAASFECIAMFDGFQTLDRWDAVPIDAGGSARGTWIELDDGAVETTAAATHGYLSSRSSFTDAFVVTAGTVLATSPQAPNNVGLWARTVSRPALAIDDGLVVEASDPDGHARLAISNVVDGSPTALSVTAVMPLVPLAEGTRFSVAADLRTVPQWIGGVVVGAGNAGTALGSLPSANQPIALRTFGASARFDYVLVVIRGSGTCPPR